ncbi:hypothetical protein LCGC14_3120310, partial [marine sediment metagenome]
MSPTTWSGATANNRALAPLLRRVDYAHVSLLPLVSPMRCGVFWSRCFFAGSDNFHHARALESLYPDHSLALQAREHGNRAARTRKAKSHTKSLILRARLAFLSGEFQYGEAPAVTFMHEIGG